MARRSTRDENPPAYHDAGTQYGGLRSQDHRPELVGVTAGQGTLVVVVGVSASASGRLVGAWATSQWPIGDAIRASRSDGPATMIKKGDYRDLIRTASDLGPRNKQKKKKERKKETKKYKLVEAHIVSWS